MEKTGSLNSKVLDVLNKFSSDKGWGTNLPEDDYIEILMDAKKVYSEIYGSSRWCDGETIVVKLGNALIQYDWYHFTGDANAYDMGLPFDLSSVKLCEEYEVVVKRYRPIEG